MSPTAAPPNTDKGFFGLWSWTHTVSGAVFFIILYKYFGMSAFTATILLLIIHSIYEWKDQHVTYDVYDNHPGKIKAGSNFLASQSFVFMEWMKLGIGPTFHMPPNSHLNSLGDTIFYIAGIALAYHFRDKISPLFVNILIVVFLVYWIQVVILYFYVTGLGLHNKDRVNEIYSNSIHLY